MVSSSTYVWRSRGEFNQIMQRFVINSAMIGSHQVLNVGGSRRTQDFALKLLNLFMIHSRVKLKRGKNTVL